MPEVQSRTYANPRRLPRRNHYQEGPGFLFVATQGGRPPIHSFAKPLPSFVMGPSSWPLSRSETPLFDIEPLCDIVHITAAIRDARPPLVPIGGDMLTDEIAFAIAEFFDQVGPSHDVITTLVARSGLTRFDPAANGTAIVGKKRRLRVVLTTARTEDQQAGGALVKSLVEALRSSGSFREGSPDFPGQPRMRALQDAFRAEGYVLDADGQLLPLTLDALTGASLTDALEAYVRRALRGGDDDALLVGTTKDLTEAVARHALVETTGAYPTNANFEATVWLAYDRLGLTPPPRAMIQGLDQDPAKALQQALLLVAVSANRLRNEAGSGHGRPAVPKLPRSLARLSAQCSGVVSRLLLDRLSEVRGSKAA